MEPRPKSSAKAARISLGVLPFLRDSRVLRRMATKRPHYERFNRDTRLWREQTTKANNKIQIRDLTRDNQQMNEKDHSSLKINTNE
jgi:hypothetical protein